MEGNMERIIGRPAPSFSMNAVTGDGEDFVKVSLDDYKGKWLVMFFYPLDFTFVCPTEITSFSENYEDFKELHADVLAVSTDSQYSHQAWIEGALGQIKFPIASDKTMEVSESYGVLIKEEGIALRGLFIIDPEQVIRYSGVHDLNVGRSVAETQRVLKALQTGGLCAVNWEDGDENL